MKSALLIALVFCQIATFHCLPAKPLISDGFTAPEEVSSYLRRMNTKPSIYLSVSKLREGNTVECSFDDVKNLISQTLGNSGCQVVNDYSAANLELKVCISLFRTVKARPKFTSYLDFRFTFRLHPTGEEYFKAIRIAEKVRFRSWPKRPPGARLSAISSWRGSSRLAQRIPRVNRRRGSKP
jgi:hypothetical protein